VCIAGASYGGYAALAGATLEPDVYRCAASVSGVSDLPRMLSAEVEETRSARSPAVRYWTRFMGAEYRERETLAAISPARLAARAKGPILLIHGRDDTVVPYEQTTIMAKALERAGKPVEVVTLEGEDHWLSREATRLRMLSELVRFLERHNPPT
jgi:dipeptidyl aminopeptidase/acylaminoacyl peptidase